MYIFSCGKLNSSAHTLKWNLKYETASNFKKVSVTKHICSMERCMQWLRSHIVDPCTMAVRMMMCDRLEHVFILFLIEGFLLCSFLAIYDYAPEANARNPENSFAPYLNGKSNSLSAGYTRKFYIGAIVSSFLFFWHCHLFLLIYFFFY